MTNNHKVRNRKNIYSFGLFIHLFIYLPLEIKYTIKSKR